MANLELIGVRLKEARTRAGFTQEQVAAALNIARGQISYYENGHREIDLTTLMKLAALYGYSVHYFLDDSPTVEDDKISVAFRAEALSKSDLDTIAWIKRFTRNLKELNDLTNAS